MKTQEEETVRDGLLIFYTVDGNIIIFFLSLRIVTELSLHFNTEAELQNNNVPILILAGLHSRS